MSRVVLYVGVVVNVAKEVSMKPRPGGITPGLKT